jgi:phosphate-selective porin OprO/OprP
LPWYDEEANGRYLLHFGASYSYRKLGNHERAFAQTPEAIVKQGLTRTPSFVDTGKLLVSDYHVAGCEFSTVLGSLSLQGEYIFLAGQAASLKGAKTHFEQNMLLHGGYVEAMYWLTGESRNYNRKQGIYGAVTPHTNFFSVKTDDGIQTGLGAWEATARVSTLDLNNANITGGQLTDLTFGMNWYYTVRSRVMFNYTHAFLDRKHIHSNADICGVRFQYAF